jgi:hypothetical protein
MTSFGQFEGLPESIIATSENHLEFLGIKKK